MRDLDVGNDVRDGFDGNNSFDVADSVNGRTAISGVGTTRRGARRVIREFHEASVCIVWSYVRVLLMRENYTVNSVQ